VKTRVCIADGVTIFRAGVREVLAREKDFEVVEAVDLESFVVALQRGIDIALVDADLPPTGAFEAVARAKGHCSEVIVWSMKPGPEEVLAAVKAGATGYLRKEISAEGLVRSLRGVGRGESPLSRDLAALLIDALHSAERGSRAREIAAALSAREREVLGHIARGARNKQIAAELTISEFTVKRHVQNILHKLDLPSRRAAAALYSANADAVAGGQRVGV
jgi:two-component system, NarL family, nitrate/nitrite response regulator NarL